MPSSTILYKARTNALQLNDRNRHINKEIHCLVCDTDDKEDILYHFMLHCTAYKEQSSQSIHLQQPYIESEQNTLGQFLFDKENIEENKKLLFTILEKKTTWNEDNTNKIVEIRRRIT